MPGAFLCGVCMRISRREWMYGFMVDNTVLDDITAVQQHLLILYYLNSVKCVFKLIIFHVCAVRHTNTSTEGPQARA